MNMQKLSTFLKNYLSFILIIFLGVFLRFYHYEFFPIAGETADEYAWSHLGASLIQTGVPTSWSFFSAYEQNQMEGSPYQAPFVSPVFDHPPLFGLIPGLFQSLAEISWQEQPSIKVIRLPLIILGTINLILFAFISTRFFKRKRWQLFSLALFATLPMVVFSSRMVMAENLLQTLLLLSLLVITQKNLKFKSILILVISCLAILTKISGLVIPISIFIYFLFQKKYRQLIYPTIGAFLGLLFFAIYGFLYDWQLFLAVQTTQSQLQIGLSTLHNRFFLEPAVVAKLFFDGWLIVGLISFAVVLFSEKVKKKKVKLLISFTLVHLFFLLLAVGERTEYGWYDYIIYPQLTLYTTLMFAEVEKNSRILGLIFVSLLLLPLLRLALISLGWYYNFSNFVTRLVIISPLLLFSPVILRPELFKKILWIFLLLFICLNIIVIFNISDLTYWGMHDYFRFGITSS